jgi:hypothetical protein
VYQINFNRPLFVTDSLLFKVKPAQAMDTGALQQGLDKVKVVPNPYIATNAMEPAVSNIYLNQRRRIMFTHVPAICTIKIFTISGVLVDELKVANSAEEGVVHWDLLSQEGLEVAGGMYFYHLKVEATGEEKLGKFAIIK